MATNKITSKRKTYEVQKEVSKWSDRVVFDVAFKKDTQANLELLDEMLDDAMENFVIIAANTEACVYKIGRYMVESGILNKEITFIDGEILESYIGDDSPDWKKKERADQFFQIFGEQFKEKWVFIPYMKFPVSIGVAAYFTTTFKRCGALGCVIYSEGADNIVETLARNLKDSHFYEFPRYLYKKRKRRIENDEW